MKTTSEKSSNIETQPPEPFRRPKKLNNFSREKLKALRLHLETTGHTDSKRYRQVCDRL